MCLTFHEASASIKRHRIYTLSQVENNKTGRVNLYSGFLVVSAKMEILQKIGCFVLIMSLQMMINAHYCILLQNLEMQSFCSLHFSSNKVKVAKSDLSSC